MWNSGSFDPPGARDEEVEFGPDVMNMNRPGGRARSVVGRKSMIYFGI
jgi:hypothetical protein